MMRCEERERRLDERYRRGAATAVRCGAYLDDARVAGQLLDGAPVLFRQHQRRAGVGLALDVVGLNDGGEDGEALFRIQIGVEGVSVDASHIHDLAGSSLRGRWRAVNADASRKRLQPGARTASMRDPSSTTSLYRGVRPGGTDPGASCNVIFW